MGEDVQGVLVGKICTAIRTIGSLIDEMDLTADKLYGDMTRGSSGDDLLGSSGVGGVLPFGGLVPGSC